jgi:predicted DNA-binding protein (MmcQ/YjbR family)
MNNLILSVFTPVQWVFIGIFAAILLALLILLLYFLYVMIFKPDLKADINAMDAEFKEDKKRLVAEKKLAEAEIKRSAKGIDEKAERARQLESEAELMRKELMLQGVREDQAREIAIMTLSQLFELKNKEMKDVSADFMINTVARRVLIDSEFERRDDVADFKVPVNKTTGFTVKDIETYLLALPEVVYSEAKGKTADTFKVLGKSFVLLYDLNDGKFKLTVKCGPYYGQRLAQLYPESFGKAKFPYGMIWFTLDNTYGSYSFELVKLLIDISYNIAKAGY